MITSPLFFFLLQFPPSAEQSDETTRIDSLPGVIAVSSATRDGVKCYHGKQQHDVSIRKAKFRCIEHHAHAIENLLLPTEMCCTEIECVPMFAETRQQFAVERITCIGDGAHDCDIILHCQETFESFCKIVIAGVATAALIILAPFFMQNSIGERSFKITTLTFYEDGDKNA